MDEKDRLLLGLLRRDARRSVVALARDLGLSRTATQDRLAKLQSTGAITRFTIVDGNNSPRDCAFLIVKLSPGCRCAQIAPKIRKILTVEAIDSIAGPFDMIIRVAAENVEAIEKVRTEVVVMPGVAEVTTHVVLERWAG